MSRWLCIASPLLGTHCAVVLPTSRLITAEADKTIKVWKEDPDATPETHPIDMEEWTREVRRHKRY